MSSNAAAIAAVAAAPPSAAAALPKLPSDAEIIKVQFESVCLRILKLGQQLKVHTTFGRSKLWQQLHDNCFGPEFKSTFHGVYQPWAKKQQAKNIKSRFNTIVKHYAAEQITRPIHEKARILLAESISAKEAHDTEKENANEVQVARNAAKTHQEGNLGLLPQGQGHGIALPSLPNSVTAHQRQQFENAAKVLAPNPVLRNHTGLNATYPPEPGEKPSKSTSTTAFSVDSDDDEITSILSSSSNDTDGDDDDDDITMNIAPTANDKKKKKKKGATTAGKRAKKNNNTGAAAVVANNVAPVAVGGGNTLALVPAQHVAPAAAGGTVIVQHAQGNQPIAGASGGPARFVDEVDAGQMRRDRDVDNIDVIDSMNNGMFRAINLLCNSFGGNAVPAPVPAPAPVAAAPMPNLELERHARMQACMKTRQYAVEQGLLHIVAQCDAELAKPF